MNSPSDRVSAARVPAVSAVWIEATRPACGRWLWGMNLVERQVRELARLGVGRITIWISAASAARVRQLRADLSRLYPVELLFDQVADSRQVYLALEKAGEDLLLLEGDVVYDERIFAHLLAQGEGRGIRATGGETALWLTAGQARRLGKSLGEGGERGLASLDLETLGLQMSRPEALEHYVPSLRLTMPPLMLRVPATGDLRSIDHLMYRRTFKGVIDAVARYGYYHLVRWITRQLSRTALTPNLFTLLSILSVWGAVPCFASGLFGWGSLVAWIGVILDSVDGKLARLRLHLSETMGAVEHLAAMPGLGLWYVATGWHLSGGALLSGKGMALITWVLVAAFLLDKVATGSFKRLFGKELFDYRPLDALFHLVAARRNISLSILTLGSLADRVEPAFVAVAGWTVATLGFHLARFVWVALTRRRGEGRPC